MALEETIQTIITEFSREIWIGFITLVITGFVLTTIKNFIMDTVYYFRARMSDIGQNQKILYRGEIFVVKKITFRHVILKDNKRFMHIPIRTYIDGIKEYPHPRYDDFNEEVYFEPPWDGKKERRSGE